MSVRCRAGQWGQQEERRHLRGCEAARRRAHRLCARRYARGSTSTVRGRRTSREETGGRGKKEEGEGRRGSSARRLDDDGDGGYSSCDEHRERARTQRTCSAGVSLLVGGLIAPALADPRLDRRVEAASCRARVAEVCDHLGGRVTLLDVVEETFDVQNSPGRSRGEWEGREGIENQSRAFSTRKRGADDALDELKVGEALCSCIAAKLSEPGCLDGELVVAAVERRDGERRGEAGQIGERLGEVGVALLRVEATARRDLRVRERKEGQLEGGRGRRTTSRRTRSRRSRARTRNRRGERRKEEGEWRDERTS